MSDVDWRRDYRQATEAPPVGARARVWRAMTVAKPASRRWLMPAFAGAMAAGVLLVLALWPRAVNEARAGDGFAYVATTATLSREGRHLALGAGRLALSVWGAPVQVDVRGRRVEVEAARAVVEVAGDRVRVLPVDGSVLVDGERVTASPATRAEAGDVGALCALEPTDAPLTRAEARATVAFEAGAWSDAAAAWSEVAASSSLRAEVALVKRGELELRRLSAPEKARATFDEAAARFPAGSLAMERSLSALEAAAALADWQDVARRTQAFETAFPTSERLGEVRRARALALYALRSVAEACEVARTLSQPVPFQAECASHER
ncbi:MAG: hypothetical protein SFW67_03790 [Myxococcaceae bacterium]|nr:hypothetical protein [Myxococcaceae bacterium]